MFNFNLQPGEKILFAYRQAKFVLIKPSIIAFFLFYLPWSFLRKYELFAQFKKLFYFWVILIFLYILNRYILWLINRYIITNKRLVIVLCKNLFHKKISEAPLSKINHISSEKKGIAQTLFNVGNIIIPIIGLSEPLLLKTVKFPERKKDQIWLICEKFGNLSRSQTKIV